MVDFLTMKYWKSTNKYRGKYISKPPNTITETLNTRKPKTPNQTLHDNDPYTANIQTQTLTQEEKTNVYTIKRIMSENKTTLLSLRNQDWKKVKSETQKVNNLLTNIPTNDITELNDLVYAGEILVCKKIGVHLKIKDRKSKPG